MLTGSLGQRFIAVPQGSQLWPRDKLMTALRSWHVGGDMDRRQGAPQLDARCQGEGAGTECVRGVGGRGGLQRTEPTELALMARAWITACAQAQECGRTYWSQSRGCGCREGTGETGRFQKGQVARTTVWTNIDCNEEHVLGDIGRRGLGQGFGAIILIAWGGQYGDKFVFWTSSEWCQTLAPHSLAV